ncbi:MAG: hypothetical protein WA510_08345 [Acidobacteriaceae bacterium]
MTRGIAAGKCALLILPIMCVPMLHSQNRRLRGLDQAPPATAPQSPAPAPQAVAPVSQITAPQTTVPQTAVPGPQNTAPGPQGAAPAQTPPASAPPLTAPSLLSEPAQDAQIVFANNQLSIKADNSSLTSILHRFAAESGMKVDGLGSDERVFGTFGPGAPRDVLADLLNGTAYNLVLLGDLSNGAPRELTLSLATHSSASAATTPQATTEEAVNEPENEEPPPPPEPPQQQGTPPQSPPGVKTPQQLFEQLQRMRQAQSQGGQQQQPVQQDSPIQ